MNENGNITSYSINELKKRRAGEEVDFQFYRLEYFLTDIEHLKKPHEHDHFTLIFLTHGEGYHVIDFERQKLQPRRIFFISPGQVHAWHSFRELKGFVLLFSREFFAVALQYRKLRDYLFYNTLYHHSWLDFDKKMTDYMVNIFRDIEEEHGQQKKYAQNIIRSYLNIILFEMTRVYEKAIPDNKAVDMVDEKVLKFENLVNKNFKVMNTVSAYARQLFVTPNYLNAICNKARKKSAGEIIRERIMLEAKRLLSHSDLSIAEIGYDLNFKDNSYFGRQFKKYNGRTPAEFRKEFRDVRRLSQII